MNLDQARALVPSGVELWPVRHSESKSKREWGYDPLGRKAYVIFGRPTEPIRLYCYLNTPPEVAASIRSSADDSQTITDLLVKPTKGTDLYYEIKPGV